jgi:hypothetical protein
MSRPAPEGSPILLGGCGEWRISRTSARTLRKFSLGAAVTSGCRGRSPLGSGSRSRASLAQLGRCDPRGPLPRARF